MRIRKILHNIREWLNEKLLRVYSPEHAALAGVLVTAAIACVLFYVPNRIGVADDGSCRQIMQEAGLAYFQKDAEAPQGAYFVLRYQRTTAAPEGFSVQRLLLYGAMGLDDLFTKDDTFDLRFYSAICLVLYLPAVFLAIREMCRRVEDPAEALALTGISVLILSDVGYLSYFQSLYPEAVWIILIVYVLSLCFSLQRGDGVRSQADLVLLTAAGAALCFGERHMAVCGLALAVFGLRQAVMPGDRRLRILSGILAGAMIAASLMGLNLSSDRFTQESKLSAMTTGVLMESVNPEKTLAEFGIPARYETLTDTSPYAVFPYIESDSPELEEFYLQYDTPTLLGYYLRHPRSLVLLLELGTRSAFRIQRDYVGNYEKSAHLPERARIPFFGLWSDFKSSSMPQTLGYLLIIAVIYGILLRRARCRCRSARESSRWTPSYLRSPWGSST